MDNQTATRRPARRSRVVAAIAAVIAISSLGGCASMANGGFGQQNRTTQLQPYQTGYSPFYSPYDASRISTATVNQTATTGVGASGYAGWNGDISTPGLTAAHATLPVGSYARVTNLETGRHAIVQISSVLPPNAGRDISLSRDAAAAIGALQSGLAPVLIQPSTAPQTVQRTPPPSSSTTVVQNGQVIRRTTPPPSGGFVRYDPRVGTASLPFENPPSPARINIDGARFLQIGSYRSLANAQAALAQVSGQGLAQGAYGQARLEPAVVDGVTYHRVRIGPMASADIAAQALSDARRLGHSGARILAP